MRTKLMSYHFTAQWQKGVLNHASDALSRSPINDPEQDDEMGEDQLQSPYKLAAFSQRVELNVKLREVHDISNSDNEYQELKTIILNGFPPSRTDLPKVLKPFWRVRHDLAVDDDLIVYGCRLFILKMLRPQVLAK